MNEQKKFGQSRFNRRTVRTSSNPHYCVNVSENKRQSRTSTQRNTTRLTNTNLRGPLSTGVPNFPIKLKVTTPPNHTPTLHNSTDHLQRTKLSSSTQ